MRVFLPFATLLLALACSQVSTREAKRLVSRYNEVVSEAYRKGDVLLIDEVVGPGAPDGRRLLGLIGVRADMGITLDAHLESLEVTGVEQSRDGLQVRTREQWRYRDLKTGTQIQVGEASVDRYEMIYFFKKNKDAWLVEETRFATDPQVGRKQMPWSLDTRDAHGTIAPPASPGPGGKR
jgi:hypothetical protein